MHMAKGRPTKWATATVSEPIPLGKAGIEVVIWDKYAKRNRPRGKAVVSVGGIRWYRYKAKKQSHTITWDQIENRI
jgi:hypothetical protein